MDLVATIESEPCRYGGCWVITPRSHLADRVVAQHEFIYWPPGEVHGGTLKLFASKTVSEIARPAPAGPLGGEPGGLKGKLRALRKRVSAIKGGAEPLPMLDLGDKLVLDLRFEPYANWSHQMNRYLLIAANLRRAAGEPVTILLHAGMAGYIVRMYEVFGFEVVRSDAPVRARAARFEIDKRTSIYSLRPRLLPVFDGFDFAPFSAGEPAERLFLSRKDTRKIANEAEVLALLERYGYRRIYPEDLSPADQIAAIRAARSIVSIHGAALAPLQFHPDPAALGLIELLPVGHVTNFYRVMACQLGANYLAVRGREKPNYVKSMYTQGWFKDFSLDDFEVDVEALELALQLRHDGKAPFDAEGLAAPR
ncbi:glycosyltransferase family 61 protein [Sphingomonas sp.]|uniref:glycosyltransferase family 61 protein n=1 Tax=Sphingomonas sp. TaxID=28214 RepID=UPI001B2613FD|nr:glycosyltransferase family 61 protein [Sphingomonas sp.]MBO9712562.1 glycosyltransferase family 61 protein [Sphingomonas sp.]